MNSADIRFSATAVLGLAATAAVMARNPGLAHFRYEAIYWSLLRLMRSIRERAITATMRALVATSLPRTVAHHAVRTVSKAYFKVSFTYQLAFRFSRSLA